MSTEIPAQYKPVAAQHFISHASPHNVSTTNMIKQTLSNTDVVISRGKAITKAIAYGNYFKRISEQGERQRQIKTAKKEGRSRFNKDSEQTEKKQQTIEQQMNEYNAKSLQQSAIQLKQLSSSQNVRYFKNKERASKEQQHILQPPQKCVDMIRRYYANLNFTNPMTFQDHSYTYNSRIHPQSENVSIQKPRGKQKLQVTESSKYKLKHQNQQQVDDGIQINNVHQTSSLEINDSIVRSVLMKEKHYFNQEDNGEQRMFQSNKTYKANETMKPGALKDQFLMTFRVEEGKNDKIDKNIDQNKKNLNKSNPLLMSNQKKNIFAIKQFEDKKSRKTITKPNKTMIPHFRETLEQQFKRKANLKDHPKSKSKSKSKNLSQSYFVRTKTKPNSPFKEKSLQKSFTQDQITQKINKFNEFLTRRMQQQKKKQKQSKNAHHNSKQLQSQSRNKSKQSNWLSANQQQITASLNKIFKYKLIERYLTQAQVRNHLTGYVIAHIQPKRWILLIVDEVYKKIRQLYPGERK